MKNEELIDRAKRFVENHNCWIDSDFTAEEKADEIAGLRNNDAFEWMADFAEECVKEERKRIAELLKQFSTVSKDALDIIEREGFVFDHSGGRWEKLAFTFDPCHRSQYYE